MKRTNLSKRAYYARYLAHYTKRNSALLVLGGLFIIGVVAGTLLVRSADGETTELLLKVVDSFVEKRATQGFVEIFTSSLGSSLFFVGALFVCGFCAIAQPAELAAPLFRGMGYGFSISSLYAQHGPGAARFVALFVLPGMVLSTLAILFCCRESLRLSGSFLRCVGTGAPGEGFHSLRLYMARYIVAVVVCLAAAFIEAFFYTMFANYAVLG